MVDQLQKKITAEIEQLLLAIIDTIVAMTPPENEISTTNNFNLFEENKKSGIWVSYGLMRENLHDSYFHLRNFPKTRWNGAISTANYQERY